MSIAMVGFFVALASPALAQVGGIEFGIGCSGRVGWVYPWQPIRQAFVHDSALFGEFVGSEGVFVVERSEVEFDALGQVSTSFLKEILADAAGTE